MKFIWNNFFLLCIILLVSAFIFYKNLTLNYLPWYLIVLFLINLFLIALFFFLPDKFSILTRAWIALGKLLGLIVTPITWAIIFYSIFGVLGFFMRLFGRDVLGLRVRGVSNWSDPSNQSTKSNFDDQF